MRQPLLRHAVPFLSTSLIAFAVACGGGSGENAGAKSPSSSGSGGDETGTTGAWSNDGSSGDGASSGGEAASSGGTGGTTTTTQLGNKGDLQGAKLGDKVHTETETKGEGGPKSTHGGSANEPGRTAKDIQTIVAVRRDEARACYDKALESHPGIEGDLDIKWVIDPEGNVTEASVDTSKSQILEPSVGNCIIEVIKKIKFAPSAKGYETRTHYPFNFHPKTTTRKGASK